MKETTQAGIPTAQNPSVTNGEDKIFVRYNHKEIGLTRDEATKLAQKGLNYDKLYEKYEQEKSSKSDVFGENLLSELNKLREEIMTSKISKDETNEFVRQNISDFKELFPDINPKDAIKKPGVIELIDMGHSLSGAYLIAGAKEDLIAKLNYEKSLKSSGSIKNSDKSEEFTHKEIASMTPVQAKKNFEKILKQIRRK